MGFIAKGDHLGDSSIRSLTTLEKLAILILAEVGAFPTRIIILLPLADGYMSSSHPAQGSIAKEIVHLRWDILNSPAYLQGNAG